MEKHNVLIVEDSELNLDILIGILGDKYNVSVAVNGETVWEILEFLLPDIILLDIGLPDISGYDICRRLKERKTTRDIPIIFVTGKDEAVDETEGLKLGAVDYITKPIIPEIVKARVHNHLELKFAREKLQKQNEDLENMLQLRADFSQMLQKQNVDLEKMLQLREDLSQMIVHDIRTPLAAIMGACEMAFMEKLNDDMAELMEDISSQAKHANSFINDLLLLAKADEGEIVLHRTDVDVAEIIKNIEHNYKFISQAKKIKILYELPIEKRIVSLDENLFKRVLDNLLANALKFSPTKETVTIKLEYIQQENIGSEFPDFHLEVIDNGKGVKEEEQENIFDKYKVIESKEKNVQQVGLGLSFCKMVVAAHKGKIYVKNNQPKGSVFVIEI